MIILDRFFYIFIFFYFINNNFIQKVYIFNQKYSNFGPKLNNYQKYLIEINEINELLIKINEEDENKKKEFENMFYDGTFYEKSFFSKGDQETILNIRNKKIPNIIKLIKSNKSIICDNCNQEIEDMSLYLSFCLFFSESIKNKEKINHLKCQNILNEADFLNQIYLDIPSENFKQIEYLQKRCNYKYLEL